MEACCRDHVICPGGRWRAVSLQPSGIWDARPVAGCRSCSRQDRCNPHRRHAAVLALSRACLSAVVLVCAWYCSTCFNLFCACRVIWVLQHMHRHAVAAAAPAAQQHLAGNGGHTAAALLVTRHLVAAALSLLKMRTGGAARLAPARNLGQALHRLRCCQACCICCRLQPCPMHSSCDWRSRSERGSSHGLALGERGSSRERWRGQDCR